MGGRLVTAEATPHSRSLVDAAGEFDAEESMRRARFIEQCAWATALCGLVAACVYGRWGSWWSVVPPLALVPTSLGVGAWVRRRGEGERVVHAFCLTAVVAIVVTPSLAGIESPVYLPLTMVPLGASLMGGAGAGRFWTGLLSGGLLVAAVALPYDGEERALAWLTLVATVTVGYGATLAERARTRALTSLHAAQAEARRQVEARLEAARELGRARAVFETAFRHAPALLILARLSDGRLLGVNDAFERTLGWRRDEVLGRSLGALRIWTSEDRHGVMRKVDADGRIDAMEITFRTRAGTPVTFLASAEVLERDGEGSFLAQLVDVTERKRSEKEALRYRRALEARLAERGEQLQRSQAELKRADRLAAAGTLASGIAHQINNPIGAIVAAAQFALGMREEAGREAIREDALETIVDEAQRCGKIVKNLLKFARNEPTAKWRNDLNAVARSALESVRGDVERRGGALEADYASRPLPVYASSIDLQQVVVNLVRNAVESEPGGVCVRVRLFERAETAVLEVSDDGAGFSPEARDRAFDPFFTTRVHDGGTGLGLSLVHGIVSDHDGRVEILDNAPRGARVRLTLPLMGPEPGTIHVDSAGALDTA